MKKKNTVMMKEKRKEKQRRGETGRQERCMKKEGQTKRQRHGYKDRIKKTKERMISSQMTPRERAKARIVFW